MSFVAPSYITLKGHPSYNEAWLQARLAENPRLLGLGDLEVRDRERVQTGAGRLDLLLYDPDSGTRYEVEIQLGATDEPHLVRTIEYWDIERRRYPQFDHIAVIVAEDVTSRFLNVISLFNRAIPLIAIQLRAVQVGESFTLVATRVLDLMPPGDDVEDEGETVDRAWWEQKASTQTLQLVDEILTMVRELEPTAELKYNKHYIGLVVNGRVRNFVQFRPTKSSVNIQARLEQSDEYSDWLDSAGFSTFSYDRGWKKYIVQVGEAYVRERRDSVKKLIADAHEYFGR